MVRLKHVCTSCTVQWSSTVYSIFVHDYWLIYLYVLYNNTSLQPCLTGEPLVHSALILSLLAMADTPRDVLAVRVGAVVEVVEWAVNPTSRHKSYRQCLHDKGIKWCSMGKEWHSVRTRCTVAHWGRERCSSKGYSSLGKECSSMETHANAAATSWVRASTKKMGSGRGPPLSRNSKVCRKNLN